LYSFFNFSIIFFCNYFFFYFGIYYLFISSFYFSTYSRSRFKCCKKCNYLFKILFSKSKPYICFFKLFSLNFFYFFNSILIFLIKVNNKSFFLFFLAFLFYISFFLNFYVLCFTSLFFPWYSRPVSYNTSFLIFYSHSNYEIE
jgi:hypothetical protein